MAGAVGLMAVELYALHQTFQGVHLGLRRAIGDVVALAESAGIAAGRQFREAEPRLWLGIIAEPSQVGTKFRAFGGGDVTDFRHSAASCGVLSRNSAKTRSIKGSAGPVLGGPFASQFSIVVRLTPKWAANCSWVSPRRVRARFRSVAVIMVPHSRKKIFRQRLTVNSCHVLR